MGAGEKVSLTTSRGQQDVKDSIKIDV